MAGAYPLVKLGLMALKVGFLSFTLLKFIFTLERRVEKTIASSLHSRHSIDIQVITKPIANQIKETAQRNKSFREACIGFGKSVNRMTMRLQLRSMNVEVKEIKSHLDEQQAIKRASEALSELFVFGVFSTVIVGQAYYTNKIEEQRIEEEERHNEKIENQIKELNRQVKELSKQLERIGGVVNENRESIHNLLREEKEVVAITTSTSTPTTSTPGGRNNGNGLLRSWRPWWWFS